jgi:tetratricopeptide (TPR) repeat protein
MQFAVLGAVLGPSIGVAVGAGVVYPDNEAASVDRANGERLLMQGRTADAIRMLQTTLGAQPDAGQIHLLLCRAFYSEERVDRAVSECEAALQTLSRNSEAQDWMGRVYGMEADQSGPITGLKLARRVKAAFATAVMLDPGNGAAVNHLSEYLVNAPALVGGGLDQAEALAAQVQPRLPEQAHRIRALAAEKRHDYDTAEREFRAAVGVANRPEALADLGAFYGRRREADKAVVTLRECLQANRAHDAASVDAASLLHDIHREPELAEGALRSYLNAGNKSDAAPVIRVYVLLGKLRAEAGDKAGAKIEFGKALELAPEYAPAKRALHDL